MTQNGSHEQGSFSIVVIPDTQTVTRTRPDILQLLGRSIADQAQEKNIKMVLHLGDVVDNGAEIVQQWEDAKAAFEPLQESGLPLMISLGNHDYDNMLETDRSASMFNRFFGLERLRDQPWFGGAFEEGKAENVYAKLDIGGTKFLFISLEFGPRDSVMEWACGILDAHPDHQAIINTHTFMYLFGERTRPGDNHNPKDYKGADGVNDGEDLWTKWLSSRKNVHSIFSGHHVAENLSYRMDRGDHGNIVFQAFQNWQMADLGGEGRYLILTYDRVAQVKTIQVFNPLKGAVEEHACFNVRFPLETGETTLLHAPREGWEKLRHPQG